MKRVGLLVSLLALVAWTGFTVDAWAVGASVESSTVKAGKPIVVKGSVAPGQDLFVVVSTETLFKSGDAIGPKEKGKLTKKFGDTAIPPNYYVVTNMPEKLATPKASTKGQTTAPMNHAVACRNFWFISPDRARNSTTRFSCK